MAPLWPPQFWRPLEELQEHLTNIRTDGGRELLGFFPKLVACFHEVEYNPENFMMTKLSTMKKIKQMVISPIKNGDLPLPF